MIERIKNLIIIVLTVMLFSVWQANAGTPAGPGTPPASTSSYTLADIYNRLNAGTAGSQSNFTEPSVAPGTGTMHTLNDIMAKAPSLDGTNGATVADVATGKTFWGLTSGEWGVKTGTATLGGSASVPKTGQTTSYATGDDGDLEKGVAWPNPRFTDNSNGTITDNFTGLIWLKNANCFGTQTWANALSSANSLANGSCGLTDSSTAGQWRLPNVRELQSLVDYGRSNQALPSGHPFSGVQLSYYWSSSTYAGDAAFGWGVYLGGGSVDASSKASSYYVWPVRGGQ